MNKHLSTTGRAEMYAHEAYGHALMYVRTCDRVQSAHQSNNTSEEHNIPLKKMIIKHRLETIKNMQKR